tara:strand:+ start:2263 stop:2490 length:228 start_codon:yes stop_codon:yes gene_type:complete
VAGGAVLRRPHYQSNYWKISGALTQVVELMTSNLLLLDREAFGMRLSELMNPKKEIDGETSACDFVVSTVVRMCG